MSCPRARSEWDDVGVIVLAGGRSTRMGADKAQVRVDGRRLVDKLVQCLPEVADIVVVTPQPVTVPRARVVSEDPPYGGPVAGIAAGEAALAEACTLVAVLAVDAPASPRHLPGLVSAVRNAPASGCAVVVDGSFLNPLCAVWRRDALQAALVSVGTRDVAAKALVRAAGNRVEIAGNGWERDFDTPDELSTLGNVEL
ncbi:molybdenum cofactor guanylyltransferase [Corynebacterium sp. LK2510]|uniref:molybdenum cofactor guanylyltransferase n=1 Tax=Corynebacterium sp. LK2510 TaxID=3110472 RepID=UPI0034CDFFD0